MLRLMDARIADNNIGVTFAGNDANLRDSLVVGATENETGPAKPLESQFSIRGFEFYDGHVGVERTRFVDLRSNAQPSKSALETLQHSPFFTDPTNYARGLSFENGRCWKARTRARACGEYGATCVAYTLRKCSTRE